MFILCMQAITDTVLLASKTANLMNLNFLQQMVPPQVQQTQETQEAMEH